MWIFKVDHLVFLEGWSSTWKKRLVDFFYERVLEKKNQIYETPYLPYKLYVLLIYIKNDFLLCHSFSILGFFYFVEKYITKLAC